MWKSNFHTFQAPTIRAEKMQESMFLSNQWMGSDKLRKMVGYLSMGHHTHTVELVEATSYSERVWHYTAEKRKEWLFNNRFCKSGKDMKDDFFCWQLLGYVPGGAPFSQLNIGVTDAMAIIKSWWGSSSKTTKTCETRPENHPQKPSY